MSDYSFWHAQLAGETPECTPGTPHAGFYRNRRRDTFEIPLAERKVGGSRKRVVTEHDAVAVWQDEGGWRCLVTRPNGEWRMLTDDEAIDALFSRCCRDALTHAEYEAMTKREKAA